MAEYRVVRIKDITAAIPPGQIIDAVATALEELPIAEALVMIHGRERGLKRYRELGGHVWFDDDGEPVLHWADTSGGDRE